MSEDTLIQIIKQAMQDISFRQQLLAHESSVLAGYDLSQAEMDFLASLAPEAFEDMAGNVEEGY